MKHKLFFLLAICLALLLLCCTMAVNYLVNPYSQYQHSYLNLPYKSVRNTRTEKVALLQPYTKIDQLILGSSRSMLMDPKIISSYLQPITFNASVNSALPEDMLGFLLLLEQQNRLPSHLIIGFDFFILNEDIPTDQRFLNSPLNFMNKQQDITLLSMDMFIDSLKTLYANLQKKTPTYYFDEYGLEHKYQEKKLSKTQQIKVIQKTSTNYFQSRYSRGDYQTLSPTRINLLKRLKILLQKYQIDLTCYITPVHDLHLTKIQQHPKLSLTLRDYKSFIQTHFNCQDFMIHNALSSNSSLFYDATHPKKEVHDRILHYLLGKKAL